MHRDFNETGNVSISDVLSILAIYGSYCVKNFTFQHLEGLYEHQDYLGMPSVVMAVNLRCRIKITERDDRKVVWSSPKLGDQYSGSYDLNNLLDSEIAGVQITNFQQ